MRIRGAEFLTSAADQGGWPRAEAPEVAFAGRSNVGKSSLINFLVNRKALAKTSATPGKTRLVNFFRVEGEKKERFVLVDLPGYGYAKVPLAERSRWRPMIEGYLRHREALRGVVLLIDARRGPHEMDLELLEWLAAVEVPALVVLTKADKLKRGELRDAVDELTETLTGGGGLYGRWSGPVLSSVPKKQGKREILDQIAIWLEDPPRLFPAA